MEKEEEKKDKKPIRRFRWLRRLARVFLGILIFLILLLLFIRSPWGQNIIVGQAVKYVKDKTGTEVSVGKLFVTFDGNIQLDDLYLADKKGDTLVYSKHLEASIPLLPIIKGDGFGIDYARWDGFKARVSRRDSISGFNYQFLMDAFVVEDTTTTSEPVQVSIGDLDFSNFDITFKDDVEELDAIVQFEKFHLSMNELDLEQMIVDIDAVSLTNAVIKYDKDTVTAFAKAEKDSDPNTDTTIAEAITDDAGDSPLPLITVGNLKMDRVALEYESVPDAINFNSIIGLLETSISKADVGASAYTVDYFNLSQSHIKVAMKTVVEDDATAVTSETAPFEWPDFVIDVNDLALRNNSVDYRMDGAAPVRNTFDPNAIVLTDFNLLADKILYKNKEANAEISELIFEEASGINVKQFAFALTANDKAINITDLNAQVNNNALQGNVMLGYTSMDAFISNPDKVKLDVQIPRYMIDLADIFRFQPDLRSNEYLLALSKRPLTGSLKAKGSTAALQIPNLVANWGNQTAIMATGSLRNATDPNNLYIDFPSIKMRSTRADLTNFISEKDLGIQLPERFSLAGNAQGRVDDITAKATLTTSSGTIKLDGGFKNQKLMTFNADVEAVEVDLGAILQNPQLGKLNLSIKTNGSGSTLNNLDAVVDATISSFTYNDYEIKDLPINGKFKDGNGSVTSKYRDKNIDLDLDSQIKLDSVATEANMQLDIAGVDLRAFGITTQNVKAAGKISAFFKGDAENFEVKSTITDGIAVFDEQSYLLGNLNLSAFVNPDSTSVDVKNKMLDLELRSNADPTDLTAAMKRHIDRYLSPKTAVDTIKPVVMRVKGTISPAPILRDVILPSLEALDTIRIAVDFNELDRKLDADIKVPYVKYAGSEIDSLLITSTSDAENLTFNLGFKNVVAGPLHIKRTNLNGVITSKALNIDFVSYDEEEVLMQFNSALKRRSNAQGIEELIYSVKPENLTLNKQSWTIPADNSLTYNENELAFNDFKLSNGSQSVEFSSNVSGITKDHLGILLNDFKLQSIISLLNSDEELASGSVDGKLVLEDIFNKLGFSAGLSIDDLKVLEVPLGTMGLDAGTEDGQRYTMDMSLNGNDIDLAVDGSYVADPEAAQLDLNLDLQKLGMQTLTGIASDFLSEGSGNLSGKMKITGTTAAPDYVGTFRFNDAKFTVDMLNAPFEFRDEELIINNDGLSMADFTIRDADDNTFVVDGLIGTEELLTPTFDLRMKAENFTALNSTASDNDLYYGKATFDATATITGNSTVPVVDLTFNVDDSTNVTYVIPGTELDIVQRDGIVQFVNKENPDDILTRTEEESATLTGFDITANLKIGKEAVVNIIVDPTTGDNLQVSGDADLKFRMTPNGRMTLAGRYEIDNGHYELSLYDIVKRKFDLKKGGIVSWSGDPFDADLNVSAIYEIETSASALMASQTSGADQNEKNKFRQELPFLVYLNVDGELLKPIISFELDLPENERGYASGQVYGRLRQLNTQDQELNKQVFSLLVLNKFFPTSGADGSSGGTATIARDNINQALSDQLNQFGGKLLGNSGIDLNFGLDSFTDYQSGTGQDRTQLDVTASKKLLDDRLIVSVGSEVDIQGSAAESEGKTPVVGNVSLEYLLNESGQWRLKGFRRNQYDNVIDGQLVVSGISLIFTKEFNEFKNLFTKTVQEAAADEKRKEEAAKKREEEKAKAKRDEEEERQKQLDATKKEREAMRKKENENEDQKQ
ncbi:translocation/assembly module TamB domain-containing protein [Nonlabens antarcticus]|uniref:translocation/assembly module TamB domain-containing protein n=1 Tax=Nonlabens antarcticus TaxID=392714 RepID=UPI00293BED4F|nr:translocation/assembly module TamB domain-containing protein [Nonlabens antarcticus]